MDKSSNNTVTFGISTWSIIKVILLLLVFYFLYLIRDVVAIVFISLIFAAALDPWVDWFERFKVPRGISVVVMYVIVFAFISLIVFLVVPAILEQLNDISQSFPAIFEKVSGVFYTVQNYSQDVGIAEDIQRSIGTLQSALIKATGGVLSTVVSIFGGLVSFFAVLVITFYLTVEEKTIKRFVLSYIPDKSQEHMLWLINAMQRKIGLWLRGQLILMVIIGIMTYIGLSIIGIEYALILALIAGVAEFIPFLGPIIASIPAIFIALTQSPLHAVFVVLLYFFIQQLENNFIVPKVMQKAVGLNPLVVIVVLLVGAHLAGVVGAILAVPVATAFSVVLKDKLGHSDPIITDDA